MASKKKNPKTTVEYFDEEGNPVDLRDIDPDAVQFVDEEGRDVDINGDLIEGEPEDEQAPIPMAVNMLNKGQLKELIVFCKRHLLNDPRNVEMWKLLAVGSGRIGQASEARKAFLCALEIDPTDALTVANYITSCFASGDKKSAIEGINVYFDFLGGAGRSIVLESLLEAVKENLIQFDDLPHVLFHRMKNISNEYRETTIVKIKGFTIVYVSKDFVDNGHGYWITLGRKPEVLAYMAGYHFSKNKPIIIEILSRESKIWEEMQLEYNQSILLLRSTIESLIDESGIFRVHPNKQLTNGFHIRGGF